LLLETRNQKEKNDEYVKIADGKSHPYFENYDEDEETTCISKLTYLQFSATSAYVICPLLSVCTGLIFALCLKWYQSLRIRMFYNPVDSLCEATHVLVEGKLEDVRDIVELYSTQEYPMDKKDSFKFRYI
jgi:hypothetical protein